MDIALLERTARLLVAPGKGILAADESTGTIAKRFASIGAESTPETRRVYRQMILFAPGSAEFISGVILFDETLRQQTDAGDPIPVALARAGVMPGIKVDTGAKPLPGRSGEWITEGLDGLRDRLGEYAKLGAKFAKWRAVIEVSAELPSSHCVRANADALARYASLCQEAGLVPIVEPEVMMEGTHDIERCEQVTHAVLDQVFRSLRAHEVALEGILLKPNMVIAGKKCPHQATVEEVASRTVRCLRRQVPAAVPGVVFLSGGQSDEQATAHLNAMNADGARHPWELSFSYGRALQAAALAAWSGKPERLAAGAAALVHRARCNGAARWGRWDQTLERLAPT